MTFVNIGLPKMLCKGFVLPTSKEVVTTEPMVLIDSSRLSYVLPVHGFGVPLKGFLWVITDYGKFKQKILDKFGLDMFEIKASNADGKKIITFVTAARPFKNIDLSLQQGYKHKSKHLKDS
jgi:hypothetical protein